MDGKQEINLEWPYRLVFAHSSFILSAIMKMLVTNISSEVKSREGPVLFKLGISASTPSIGRADLLFILGSGYIVQTLFHSWVENSSKLAE